MGQVFQFLKSTIIGGLLVLVPLGLLAGIVAKSIAVARDAIEPALAMLPFKTVGGVSLAVLVAMLGLLLVCFLAGLLAQMALTRRLVDSVEQMILSKIPGYALMKSVGENFVGVEETAGRCTLLVKLETSWQIGFLMDTLPDGRKVVFLPDAPNVMVGRLHIFAPEQVEEIMLPISTALKALGGLGIGLGAKWPAANKQALYP